MRVLTFSTHFPKGHPKEGQQTFFREKIWAGLADRADGFKIPDENTDWDWHEYYNARPKWHTIRSGNRWKVGDKFSPRIWSAKPYRSKQIEFAPPIQIKKIWTFRISYSSYYVDETEFLLDDLTILAKNDGLSVEDFESWFAGHGKKKDAEFVGQILSWSNDVNYNDW